MSNNKLVTAARWDNAAKNKTTIRFAEPVPRHKARGIKKTANHWWYCDKCGEEAVWVDRDPIVTDEICEVDVPPNINERCPFCGEIVGYNDPDEFTFERTRGAQWEVDGQWVPARPPTAVQVGGSGSC